jgi:hypothetical protein
MQPKMDAYYPGFTSSLFFLALIMWNKFGLAILSQQGSLFSRTLSSEAFDTTTKKKENSLSYVSR